MKKICMVVQRYGVEVNGGAELHCRKLAEKMSSYYDVTVLTTKALDYISWTNYYCNDYDSINSIKVIRFACGEKNVEEFNEINRRQCVGMLRKDEEEEWLKKQGPYCPGLIEYIKKNKDEYAVFIFFTYLYYPTVKGIKEVYNKSILIPTAHDEPALELEIYKEIFKKTRAIFYNSLEEKRLVELLFNNQNVLNSVGGVGIDDETIQYDLNKFKEKYSLESYLLYAGRISDGKGCGNLFRYFQRFKERYPDKKLDLVLIGKKDMCIPEREDIKYLGFVEEEEKRAAMEGAFALILPSKYESLSMVCLEAQSLKVPIIVDGECKVTKGHCVRGNGGLYYESQEEFIQIILYLLSKPVVRDVLGQQGKEYVTQNYTWQLIIKKLDMLIRAITEEEEIQC